MKDTIQPLHFVTPAIQHARLSKKLNKNIWMKMECFQPAGSFKIRGIGHLCQVEADRGIKHFVCPSGGNAGYAAAFAGKCLGIRTTIIVPTTTSKIAQEKIKELGANLEIYGDVWDDSNKRAIELVAEPLTAYIPAFDHPLLWAGHASLVDELKHQIEKPDAVVLAVGGGGLMCGVLEGMHRHHWQSVPVIACETRGADSFRAAIEANKVVTIPAITSIATSLGAKRVAQMAFDWTKKHEIRVVTVSDKSAVSSIINFADDMRTLVEPACGAALTAVYENLDAIKDCQNILVIACGGIGVSLGQLAKWKQDFGV